LDIDFTYHGHDKAHDIRIEAKFVNGLLPPGTIKCIVYVGCCCAYEAGLLADIYPDAEVHAIEPVRETFDLYLGDNRPCCGERVKTHNLAIADHDGEITLNLAAMNTQHSVLKPRDWVVQDTRVGPCLTLKSFCAENGLMPDMLVIDAEGITGQILMSAGSALNSVSVVMAETEPAGANVFDGGDTHESVNEFLAQKGFDMCLQSIPEAPVRQLNSVWIRK